MWRGRRSVATAWSSCWAAAAWARCGARTTRRSTTGPLRSNCCRRTWLDDNTFVQRFRREADAAAQLNNPHIIPIHNYGEIDGRLYVDMRLIEGRDLQAVLADGPLEPGRAVRIIEQVAKALHAAHKIGLVHRDVKPSNILLDEDDFAYLIDFGIARGAEETRLTGTGSIIGSWHYMSPERLRAGQVDARADIYALACVLYECLTGSPPYPGDNFEQQITAHLTAPPPRPSTTQPNVPAAFDRVIATGMAKDPDQRYATTVELARRRPRCHHRHRSRGQPKICARPHPVVTQPARHRPPPARPADAVWQQPSGLNLAATSLRPPGRSPVPQPRPADRPPPQIGTPPPRPYDQRRQVKVALIAATVVILAAVGITGYLLWPHSPASQTPTAQPAPPSGQTAQPAPPPGQTAQPAPPPVQTVLPFTGLNSPDGVAVDAAGNVYVTDYQQPTGAEAGGGLEHPDRAAVHRPQRPRRCGGGHRRQRLRHRRCQQSGAEAGGGLDHPDRAAVHRPRRPRRVWRWTPPATSTSPTTTTTGC